ncbi:MAG: transporter permease [Aeromicrobium sp.]|jgi:branched-chain amino acid transport system permease protein|nr:transporter permease [Aeromicrobium sp.]
MTDLLQLLVSGLASGSIYGALALAIVFVFRSTGVVNFSQGELAMISTFVTLGLYKAGAPLVIAIIGSMVISFVLGAAIERVLIRPVQGRSEHAPSIITLGLFLGLSGIAGWIWGLDPETFPGMFPERSLEVGSVRLSYTSLGIIAVLLATVAVLYVFFERTRLGLMMKAAASNPATSRLAGVPVSRLLMCGWGVASAVGALAGALIAQSVYVSPSMMVAVIIYALAAAALGGLSSPVGAVVGGWIIGVAEAVVSDRVGFIGGDLKIVVPLVIIFAVLLVKPTGLFGAKEVSRV